MRALRRRLHVWFTALDLDQESATNMLTAASEAAANAVEHAYRDRPAGDVEVTGTVTLTDVELTVRDHGSWTSHEPGPSRNRGFLLIRAITDEMVIERENGTTVYMRLARPQPQMPRRQEKPFERWCGRQNSRCRTTRGHGSMWPRCTSQPPCCAASGAPHRRRTRSHY